MEAPLSQPAPMHHVDKVAYPRLFAAAESGCLIGAFGMFIGPVSALSAGGDMARALRIGIGLPFLMCLGSGLLGFFAGRRR